MCLLIEYKICFVLLLSPSKKNRIFRSAHFLVFSFWFCSAKLAFAQTVTTPDRKGHRTHVNYSEVNEWCECNGIYFSFSCQSLLFHPCDSLCAQKSVSTVQFLNDWPSTKFFLYGWFSNYLPFIWKLNSFSHTSEVVCSLSSII